MAGQVYWRRVICKLREVASEAARTNAQSWHRPGWFAKPWLEWRRENFSLRVSLSDACMSSTLIGHQTADSHNYFTPYFSLLSHLLNFTHSLADSPAHYLARSLAFAHAHSLTHSRTDSLRFLRHQLIVGKYDIDEDAIDDIMSAFDRQDKDNDDDIDVDDILSSKVAFTDKAISYRSLRQQSSEALQQQANASAVDDPGSNSWRNIVGTYMHIQHG